MIRVAVAGDLGWVLAVERGAETAPHWAMQEYARILHAESAVLLVEEPVGFAVGRVVGEEAEIESVVVRAQDRGRGVGRALCAAVIDWARGLGAAVVELEVRSASVGARRLYEGLGFTQVGIRPGYYHDPKDDAVLMRCRLQ